MLYTLCQISEVDVNKELGEIQKELEGATGQRRVKLVKRLDVIYINHLSH